MNEIIMSKWEPKGHGKKKEYCPCCGTELLKDKPVYGSSFNSDKYTYFCNRKCYCKYYGFKIGKTEFPPMWS